MPAPFTETPAKKHDDPHTPVAQSISSFPPFSSTATPTSSHVLYSRRPSLIDGRTACSSSSSLYELNVSASNLAGAPVDQQHLEQHMTVNSSLCNSSSDDDSDTDIDLDHIHTRHSTELFSRDYDLLGANSPTFNTSNVRSTSTHTSDYFSHPNSSSTPIFKRLVSKSALKPQLKAFRRISTELQLEHVPFQNEINHEKLVLLNLKDEEDLMTRDPHTLIHHNPLTLDEESRISKFDIIKRANESWNQKKHTFLNRNSSSGSATSETPPPRNIEDQERLVRKRSFDKESEINLHKRRAVSTSPITADFRRRGSVQLVTMASSDLEKMTLKND